MTLLRGRDRIEGRVVDMEVVTPNRSRDIRFTRDRTPGRDVIQLSRHQLQGIQVATSFSGRDISYKERRSRHQLQGKKVATSFSGRDISYKERRS